MTDQTEADTSESNTYEITSTRRFEVDFSPEQEQMIMQQTHAETVDEALETVVLRQEKKKIKPEEKLLGIDVQADGPSDD